METLLIDILKAMGVDALPRWLSLLISSLDVLLIVAIAFVARHLIMKLIDLMHQRLVNRTSNTEQRKRIDTLNRILVYITSIGIAVIAAMFILSELGVSIAPFLATAGVVGLAITFGSQSLIKDYFTGAVMLLENQIRQGDFVEVAGKAGKVEEVTLRYVRLRDSEGAVHFVPNSAITSVTNRSRDFSYAVVEVGVGYSVNLGDAYTVLRLVSDSIRAREDLAPKILEDLEILGVNQLADSAVTLRLRMKTKPLEQWVVRRALLGEIKDAFQSNGIEIPFPQRVIRVEGDMSKN
jgi:moderate conductance mechanosensitive channel